MGVDWRHVIALTLLVFMTVVGGIVYETSKTCSGTIVTRTPTDVPEEAPVSPAESVMENDHVAEAVEEAADHGSGRSVLSSEEMAAALDTLDSIPEYGGGWMVRYENTTIVLNRWCTDRE